MEALISPQVSKPRFFSFSEVTLPTPGIFLRDKFSRKLSMSLGPIVHWPLGLFKSEAIFAANFNGAIPAEAV